MNRDQIHSLLDRWAAAWRARDAHSLAMTYAEDATVLSPASGVLEGRAQIERVFGMWLSSFPDLVVTSDDLLVEGDRVVAIACVSGTHVGEFFGISATGRHLELTVALVMTMRNGEIVRERRIYDFTGALVQIGVLRAKPA
jgi:steroid delta-isomerase-like uncharacterized protein